MAFGYYMNMESLNLKTAKEFCSIMNDSITEILYNEVVINDELAEHNYKYGFLISTLLISVIESSLNIILREYISEDTENFVKSSIDEKMELIYLYYRKDIKKLKSTHYYKSYKNILNIRNELIHYKYSHIADCTMLTDSFKIEHIAGKKSLNEIFTKSKMNEYISNIVIFLELYVKEIDMKINKEVPFISCDGKGDDYRFVELLSNE